MRVALETNAVYVTRAGVARYVRGLLQGLRQAAPPDIEISPLAWEVENLDYRQPGRALKTFYREMVWARFRGPRHLRAIHADLLHSPNPPIIRPLDGMKEVVTLHDLATMRHPERFRRWQGYSGRGRLGQLNRADRIICISRFTADEAMSLLNLPAAKIVVVYNGCDFQPNVQPPEAKPECAVPSEFFLFVGSLEPGKNLALLKDVYALAESRGVALPPLFIVGARWEGVGNEGAPPKEWNYLGYQSDAVLVHLYRRALALLFPTKYEGFGFPLVEARALGCPVICSAVASLPEVGGDAACFVPMTPEDYLKAMQRVGADTVWRQELIAKGRVRSAGFSWPRCASQVLEVYQSVLRGE
jgi:glycosyltransferase involved in cell wall biosynthesis